MVDVYRVKSVNPGANTKKNTWVRANSAREAEQWVRETYSRHMIEYALPRAAPDDADVVDLT